MFSWLAQFFTCRNLKEKNSDTDIKIRRRVKNGMPVRVHMDKHCAARTGICTHSYKGHNYLKHYVVFKYQKYFKKKNNC